MYTCELIDSASLNLLSGDLKQMFEKGTIRTVSAAEGLLKPIQENEAHVFHETCSKLEEAEKAKAAKRKAGQVDK